MKYYACPVCAATLPKEFYIGNRDEMIIVCETCGEYGLSLTYYEDFIEGADEGYKKLVKAFLQAHKPDQQRPFICSESSFAPKGFKNYLWSNVAGLKK